MLHNVSGENRIGMKNSKIDICRVDWGRETIEYLLSTSVLSASPSISSATISSGLLACMAHSRAGTSDCTEEIFFSENSTSAFSNSHFAPADKSVATVGQSHQDSVWRYASNAAQTVKNKTFGLVDEVWGDVSSVKFHSLNHIQLILGCLAILHGNHT